MTNPPVQPKVTAHRLLEVFPRFHLAEIWVWGPPDRTL